MSTETAPRPDQSPPAWQPRRFGDPSTIAAFIRLFFALFLIAADGLDVIWFTKEITFGYWPYVLMLFVGFWFFGIILWRLIGKD